MYENPNYNEPFSHSLFGNHTFIDRRQFDAFRTENSLPYDCFWDGTEDYVETFVEEQTDGLVAVTNNDVIAIMPTGIIIKYDLLNDGDFEEWQQKMYNQAYSK
ncbi:MAG: hypothetical protein JXR69_01565 [Candidatus Delongbacteria bacterium]|nr:hypothetical protein [Candidatus Delongbacteria bacterium]